MEYQVWTHDEYEGWRKVDCGDISAARREILKALMKGQEPLLTVAVPYDFDIKVKEDKIGEPTKSKPKSDKGPVVEGDSEVRPGATRELQKLDQPGGTDSAVDSVPGEGGAPTV